MRRGEESLRLELARRRAATPEERARVPVPPGPTASAPLPLLLAAAVVLGVGAGLARLARKRRCGGYQATQRIATGGIERRDATLFQPPPAWPPRLLLGSSVRLFGDSRRALVARLSWA